MYTPRSFAEPDTSALHEFMHAHPFATLVTARNGLFATHLPLVLRAGVGPLGTLEGHIARANPHMSLASDPIEAMVIFSGEQAHITPTWYPSKQVDGRVVPTWNYVAVHAHGMLRLADGADWLHAHLERLSSRHEQDRGSDWRADDPPADYVAQQLKAIIGVEIPIDKLDGKWKMSQNRSEADVDGVVKGLGQSENGVDREVARIVKSRRRK